LPILCKQFRKRYPGSHILPIAFYDFFYHGIVYTGICVLSQSEW
jgi:hypothetical protein